MSVGLASRTGKFRFLGKAATLAALRGQLCSARVLDLIIFDLVTWTNHPEAILEEIEERFSTTSLIVRSSAHGEDGEERTSAGKYLSVSNVTGREHLIRAITSVFKSYDRPNSKDQVFVQPLITNALFAGVAMTRDPTSDGPYYVINYSDSGSTSNVTAGQRGTKVLVVHHSVADKLASPLAPVLRLLDEVRSIACTERIDVEFAIDTEGLILLQARPMTPLTASGEQAVIPVADSPSFRENLLAVYAALAENSTSCFSVMADWNPAEMIGVRPRHLAYSLYEELITKVNWASARFRYGYFDMRDQTLMSNICGTPYIKVDSSIRSFLPAGLSDSLADRIVSLCCARVLEDRSLHDKIEFSVVPTCWTSSLAADQTRFSHIFAGLTASDAEAYVAALKRLTEALIGPSSPFFNDLGLLKAQAIKLAQLKSEQDGTIGGFWRRLAEANIAAETFSGMARAAFVATALLKDIDREQGGLMSVLDDLTAQTPNVAKKMAQDFSDLDEADFLERHGHIRPGTYDITVPRYDEAPGNYFDSSSRADRTTQLQPKHLKDFVLSFVPTGLNVSAQELQLFAETAIGAREESKYLYSGFVSEALRSLSAWGQKAGLSAEVLSHLTITDLRLLYSGKINNSSLVKRSEKNRSDWLANRPFVTPSVFSSISDFLTFEVGEVRPTFVTRKKIVAPAGLVSADSPACSIPLTGRIVLIENADPGYDWLFTRGIAGLVTAYGGENSHMAVRAREFNMPAAIGVGERTYRNLCNAGALLLNCQEGLVQLSSGRC